MRPIAYVSRATLDSERRWTPLDLEPPGIIVWAIKRLRGYLWDTKFRIFSDHKDLENVGKVGDHNARVQKWLEYPIAFDYTLEYRKRSANGNADFLSRLPQRATEHDCNGSSGLTPVDDEAIYFVRACGLLTPSTSVLGIGVGGLAPQSNPYLRPLLMRPWIMQACHLTVSCHLGTARTLRMLERLYWWVGMSICTRWWLRHCLKCQARKTPRPTVRWPVISIPGPGIAVSVDYFGPLLVTPRGNTYILLFTDRCSRHVDMFAATAVEFTAEGTANILLNRYIPLRGCSRSTLSDNGLQFCFRLSHVVYELLGVRKIATSSNHPSGNGGVERVNHTMAQRLAIAVNECQDDWNAQLTHVAYNNSIRLAPPLAWPQRGSHGQVFAPSFHYFRPLRGRQPSETGPRPPRILRPGVRTPTARQRYCSRDACHYSFSCGAAKLSPLGRFAPGSQLRCG